MAYAALLSVVQVLEQITLENHFSSLFTIKQQIKTLHERFCFLQSFLEDDPPHSDAVTDFLESRIREAAYHAEDVIQFHVQSKTSPGKECLVSCGKSGSGIMSLQSQRGKNTIEKLYQDVQHVVDEVDSVVKEVVMIMDIRKIKRLQFSNNTADPGSPRVAPVAKTTMVGSDDELIEIKEQLCGGSSNLQVIPIVGMGGIGKTALASNVFHDSLIAYHFHVRTWTTITQDHKVPDILLGLLHSMTRMSENLSRRMGELADCLYKSLKGRTYLVVLDDIWSTEVWDEVKMLFPDDHNGSRIILTTRLADVAAYVNCSGPSHQRQFLNDEQSWNLLREKVFGQECCPLELEETGKLIARNCRGLPLSVILVAGLLSKISRTKYQWGNIARDVSLAVAASEEHISSKILSLSYNHLPHRLKPCFLYMGGFPEDYEIPVFVLIRLWVAEGFLKPMGSKCLEEIAEEYFDDLVKRSLVLVTKKRSNGKPRFCSIHDLLRDLCIKRGRDEKFLHPMDGIQERMENKRRLCFSKPVEWFHFKHANTTSLVIRSIFCCSYNYRVLICFNLLKTLHILEVHFETFPVEILQLFHLKFLSFTTGFIRYPTLPPSMTKLQNLQTLIVGSSVKFSSERRLVVSLPIWKMPRLRHLVFLSITLSPAPIHDEEFPILENLQTLSTIRNFRFTKEATAMIPNLRKLKVVYNVNSDYELNNLVLLHQLETLNLVFQPSLRTQSVPLRFGVPLSIKKLTLRGCGLSWEDMTMLGTLPNLEVLKLLDMSVVGKEWDPIEGEFPMLKFLQMQRLDLKHWEAENAHFPSLETLIIKHCLELESIPSAIGEIATLQMIEIEDGKLSAVESAELVLEEQRGMGNDVLQVRVVNTDRNSSCNRFVDLEQRFSKTYYEYE
ncbi:hypothetical protein ACS0TY_035252 [Phlomoides rotata]